MTKLVLTRSPTPCVQPCQVLLHNDGLTAELAPYPWLRLPFALGTDDSLAQLQGFYSDGPEGAPLSTSGRAAVRFLLAGGEPRAAHVRMRVTAEARPGRPANIRLNGHLVGALAYGEPQTVDFIVPAEWLKGASENEITFVVPRAGPVGQDVRHFGIVIERVELLAADSQ